MDRDFMATTPSAQRRRALAFALLPAALLLTACGKGKPETEVNVDPPDVLYNQALANLDSGDAREASKKFDEIDKEHPYSEYARRAMLMSAFLSFRRGQYQDAINDGERYVTLFPASEDAAYAQYLIGESYFRQIPDVTRDQDLAQKAEAAKFDSVFLADLRYAKEMKLAEWRTRGWWERLKESGANLLSRVL